MKKIIVVVMALSFLVGCTTPAPSEYPKFCGAKTIDSFAGSYMNHGTEKLQNRNMYLSQVLWLNNSELRQMDHFEITKLEISVREGSRLWAKAYAGDVVVNEEQIDKGITFNDGTLEVFSKTNFLPSPNGGLLVGPQTVKVHLFLDCEGNMVFQRSEHDAGLTLLIIPTSGSMTNYSIFKKL